MSFSSTCVQYITFSTRNMLMSCRPGPVLAYTRKTSPVVRPSVVPFVIHILAPSILKDDPSADGTAFVDMPNTSVPGHSNHEIQAVSHVTLQRRTHVLLE